MQVTELFSGGRGLWSAPSLRFKCGIREKVNLVHRTVPRGTLEEKKGYAVIRDILFRMSDKCSQSESVTQIIKYLFNGGNVTNGMFRGHNRELCQMTTTYPHLHYFSH